MDQKIPIWKVVELALLKGVNARGVIAFLELHKTLPEALEAGWPEMVRRHQFPPLQDIEFPLVDDQYMVTKWLIQGARQIQQGQPPLTGQIFGTFLESVMEAKSMDRAELSKLSGLPLQVLIAVERGYVPVNILSTMLPQLTAGLGADLTYMESLLEESVELGKQETEPHSEDYEA